MVIVSSREFRANQKKYLSMALSNEIVIKSRSYGSYRLVPISEDDSVIDATTLQAKIARGIAEFEQGKSVALAEGESMEDFLARMIKG